MGNDIWNLVLSEGFSHDLAKFERGFFGINGNGLEASFNVQKDAEMFASLGNGNDVHESTGESVISSDLVIDLNVSVVLVFADLEDFLSVESVLQSVSEENREGKTLSHFMGSGSGTSGIHSTEFSQLPMFGGKHTLQMLFRSSSLLKK
jgi:hypothetical protein